MDNAAVIASITLIAVMFLLASGLWISVSLGVVGVLLLVFLVGKGQVSTIGVIQFNTLNGFTYTAIPLFIFMGEMLLYSGLSKSLYRGANSLVGFLPGGLLHTNIAACAIFSAISGSSMATLATIGSVALPELEKRGYTRDRALLYGSLASGGTLGPLIPPSIIMVIYGGFVDESIGRLFMAGVFPGIVLSLLFMSYIGLVGVTRPQKLPKKERFSSRAMATAIVDIWPTALIILLVLGTIYFGVATPTESAALGAAASVITAAAYRRLTVQTVKNAGLAALKITSWCMLIVIGAQVVSTALSFSGVPTELANAIKSLHVNRASIFAIIVLLYIVLGMFIDTTSMMLLTLPVIYPIMMSLGFDSVWFGVVMVVFCEMAMVSPPYGINLFIMDGLAGGGHLAEVIKGCIPFIICMLLLIVILYIFPAVALWLPNLMIRKF